MRKSSLNTEAKSFTSQRTRWMKCSEKKQNQMENKTYWTVFRMTDLSDEEKQRVQKDTGTGEKQMGQVPQKISIIQHNLEDEDFCIFLCKQLWSKDTDPGAVYKYTAQGKELHTSDSHVCRKCQHAIVTRIISRLQEEIGEDGPQIEVSQHGFENDKGVPDSSPEDRRWN